MSEVIKLLKACLNDKSPYCYERIIKRIEQALALLEQQSKRTCPACGYKYGIDEAGNWFDEYVLLRDRLEAAEQRIKELERVNKEFRQSYNSIKAITIEDMSGRGWNDIFVYMKRLEQIPGG